MDTISKPTVLLVEGFDEKDICKLIFKSINPNFEELIDIQLYDSGGKTLLKKAKALKNVSGFLQLKHLAILVDAEENPTKVQNDWDQFKKQFEDDFAQKNCDVLILPNDGTSGALESIFIASLDSDTNSIAKCAKDFVACVGDQGALSTQARKDKVTLISYINAHTKNPYSRIGMALAQEAQNLFNFDHPSFKSLKDFLQALLDKAKAA